MLTLYFPYSPPHFDATKSIGNALELKKLLMKRPKKLMAKSKGIYFCGWRPPPHEIFAKLKMLLQSESKEANLFTTMLCM